jgi:hypothetical protein
MTTIPQPSSPGSSWGVKYDAWNRLVEVGSVRNEYDGLGRRIVKTTNEQYTLQLLQ